MEGGGSMRIIYYDGSILKCNRILVSDKEIIVDDIYTVPMIEVQRIEEDDE